jgi:hypothetical protein
LRFRVSGSRCSPRNKFPAGMSITRPIVRPNPGCDVQGVRRLRVVATARACTGNDGDTVVPGNHRRVTRFHA